MNFQSRRKTSKSDCQYRARIPGDSFLQRRSRLRLRLLSRRVEVDGEEPDAGSRDGEAPVDILGDDPSSQALIASTSTSKKSVFEVSRNLSLAGIDSGWASSKQADIGFEVSKLVFWSDRKCRIGCRVR